MMERGSLIGTAVGAILWLVAVGLLGMAAVHVLLIFLKFALFL